MNTGFVNEFGDLLSNILNDFDAILTGGDFNIHTDVRIKSSGHRFHGTQLI